MIRELKSKKADCSTVVVIAGRGVQITELAVQQRRSTHFGGALSGIGRPIRSLK